MMAVVMIRMKIIMKKTTNYYKKKTAIFRLLTESNNFFITPTIRVYFDKAYSGGYERMYLEFSWFNRTLAIKLK